MRPNKALVDTNVVIGFFAGQPDVIAALQSKRELFLPVIVLGELYYGVHRSTRREANLERLQQFAQEVQVLDCTPETAKVYGEIKAALASKGSPIPENDSWIAALAIEHDAAVMTRDSHFSKVVGLSVEMVPAKN